MLIVKGRQAVKEALKSVHKPRKIILSSDAINHESIVEIIRLAQQYNIPIDQLQRRDFLRLSEDKHQQVLARMPDLSPIGLKQLIQDQPQHTVLLDHLEDPHNMGAIIRSCEALGVTHVIYPKQRAASISTGVIRASAGAIWHVKLCPISSVSQCITQLKKAGFWIYAASEHQGEPLNHVKTLFPSVLVMGNEHKGISPLVQKMVDFFITIPQKGKVGSLNVSVAAGIAMFHMTQNHDHV